MSVEQVELIHFELRFPGSTLPAVEIYVVEPADARRIRISRAKSEQMRRPA